MKGKIVRLLLIAAVTAGLTAFLLARLDSFSASPFVPDRPFRYPVYAVTDSLGNIHVIDNAFRRVTKTGPDGKIIYTINGGSRDKGRFFYANEIAVGDDSRLYLLNYVLDKRGFFMDAEEIVRYRPDGSIDRVVYRREYSAENRDTTLIQRGRISSIAIDQGKLTWFEADENGFSLLRLDPEKQDKPETVSRHELPMAHVLLSGTARIGDNDIVYTTKRGEIRRVKNGRDFAVFTSKDAVNGGRLSVPWDCDADLYGNVFFMDLARNEIRRIGNDGKVTTVLSPKTLERNSIKTGDYGYYRQSVGPDGKITTCNEEAVLSVDPAAGKVVFYHRGAEFTAAEKALALLVWFLPVLIAVLLVAGIRYFYYDVLEGKVPRVLVGGVGIVLVTAVVAVTVMVIVFGNFSGRYKKSVEEKISQMAQIIPGLIDVERLEKITDQTGYMGPDYAYLRRQMHNIFNNYRNSWNSGYEFVLYRVIGGKLYGFMYDNDQVGMMYPFGWLENTNGPHARALRGEIATEVSSDMTGDWIYGVGPITNGKGKVVGLFETGTDVYAFDQENGRLLGQVCIEIATFLVVLILMMIELVFLGNLLERRKISAAIRKLSSSDRFSKKTLQENEFSEAFLARPLMFLFTAAVSVSVAFIPLVMKSLYRPVGFLPENLVLALPISLETLLFGISTFPAAAIVSGKGWRFAFHTGLAVTGLGLIASGLANDMVFFLLARMITGIGSGITFIAVRSYIHLEPDEEFRDRAYSNFYSGLVAGLNVGMVFGAVLADQAGYSAAFFAAFGVVLLTAVYQWVFIKNGPADRAWKPAANEIRKIEGNILANVRKIFGNREVLMFFLLIMIPVYLAGAFTGYFFPLFAESKGIANDDTGRLLLLNGLAVIYLGPALSGYFIRKLGNIRTMTLVMFFWVLSLAVFALTGSVAGAVAALIMMGVAQGVGVVADDRYFLGLPVVRRAGMVRSTGYFEFLNKIGETAGPVLFGLLILLGTVFGIWMIAIWMAVSVAVFRLLAAGKTER